MSLIHRLKAKLHHVFYWDLPIGECLNSWFDLRLYYRYRFVEKKFKNQTNQQAYLTKQYHIVEKGLALPNPRKAFGIPKITALIQIASDYETKYSDPELSGAIRSTLATYLRKNPELNETHPAFYALVTGYVQGAPVSVQGGVKHFNRSELRQITSMDFASFAKSRTSVRNFSSEPIAAELIQKAVDIARYTPSVCNRQSWKVHAYTKRETINSLLALQGGSNGFTESITQLLVVTTDIRKFTRMETHQIYVDGGLFAMNLLYALHAQNIGSCCLNTCVTYPIEKQIITLGQIPEHERLIMFIGIGNLREDYDVAISNRFGISHVYSHHSH